MVVLFKNKSTPWFTQKVLNLKYDKKIA